MVTRAERAAAQKAASLLRLASNPTRLLIIEILRERKEAYVREIAEELEMSQSAISHQLRILEKAGVALFTREGRDVQYALSRKESARKLAKALLALSR